MFERNFSRNLQGSEAVRVIIRRHPLALFKSLAFFIILLVVDFFFMSLLVRQGLWGSIVFGVILVIAAVGGWRNFYSWSLNAFVLTNQQLLDFDQRGFFHRVVSATAYNKIQDVSYSTKGFWQSLFRLGTITVQTAGNQANLELYWVGQPGKAVESINRVMHEQSPSAPPLSTQAFVSVVTQMRQTLGDQVVDDLIEHSRRIKANEDDSAL